VILDGTTVKAAITGAIGQPGNQGALSVGLGDVAGSLLNMPEAGTIPVTGYLGEPESARRNNGTPLTSAPAAIKMIREAPNGMYTFERTVAQNDACSVYWGTQGGKALGYGGAGKPGGGGGDLNLTSTTLRLEDRRGLPCLLFESEWAVRWALEKNRGLALSESPPPPPGSAIA